MNLLLNDLSNKEEDEEEKADGAFIYKPRLPSQGSENSIPALKFRDLVIAKKFGSSPYDTEW